MLVLAGLGRVMLTAVGFAILAVAVRRRAGTAALCVLAAAATAFMACGMVIAARDTGRLEMMREAEAGFAAIAAACTIVPFALASRAAHKRAHRTGGRTFAADAAAVAGTWLAGFTLALLVSSGRGGAGALNRGRRRARGWHHLLEDG